MATPIIKFKRSAVEGKRPDINSMILGELAINTYDGRIFLRRDTSGASGVDTGNYLVNPFIENNSFTGIAYTGDIEVSGVTTSDGGFHGGNVRVTNIYCTGITTSIAGFHLINPTDEDFSESDYTYDSSTVTFDSQPIATKINPDGSAVFTGIVTAAQFAKDGGTSSQFLKADGTTDANTYATTTQLGLATSGFITTSFTNTNQLTNGAGFVTFTNNNQLTNGAGYITAGSTFSGSYNDLTNTPTIPTNNNQLTNGAGYITTSFTSYNQLSDQPTIPTNNNQLTNGAGYITTSFTNTNQLTNGAGFITTSFTNTSQLTNDAGFITKVTSGVVTATTFSGNLTGDVTGDITGSSGNSAQLQNQDGAYYLNYNNFTNTPTIPTNNNQLTNGAGFITASDDITGTAALAEGLTGTPNINVGVTTATNVNISTLNLSGIGTFADDTAAGSGGLTKGDVYMTATGELRIKL